MAVLIIQNFGEKIKLFIELIGRSIERHTKEEEETLLGETNIQLQ